MALCPGDTTQWEDIHRKLGNFAPKPKAQSTKDRNRIEAAAIEVAENLDPLEACRLKELDQLEDEVEEDTLAVYRRKRLEEMKQAASTAKFGDVRQVTRTNFVHEVTEGSAKGRWVLVMLYVDARAACQRLAGPWEEAARKFPAVKFMRGVASEVVPDFPDSSTPAVLAYCDEDCKKQIVGLEEWGGAACSRDCVEWVLAGFGAVETDLEEDPRVAHVGASTWRRAEVRRRGRGDSSSEEEEVDEHWNDRCFSSNQIGRGLRRA